MMTTAELFSLAAQRQLSATQAMIYAALDFFASAEPDRVVGASRTAIAEQARVHRQTIQPTLVVLQERGLIAHTADGILVPAVENHQTVENRQKVEMQQMTENRQTVENRQMAKNRQTTENRQVTNFRQFAGGEQDAGERRAEDGEQRRADDPGAGAVPMGDQDAQKPQRVAQERQEYLADRPAVCDDHADTSPRARVELTLKESLNVRDTPGVLPDSPLSDTVIAVPFAPHPPYPPLPAGADIPPAFESLGPVADAALQRTVDAMYAALDPAVSAALAACPLPAGWDWHALIGSPIALGSLDADRIRRIYALGYEHWWARHVLAKIQRKEWVHLECDDDAQPSQEDWEHGYYGEKFDGTYEAPGDVLRREADPALDDTFAALAEHHRVERELRGAGPVLYARWEAQRTSDPRGTPPLEAWLAREIMRDMGAPPAPGSLADLHYRNTLEHRRGLLGPLREQR